MPLAQLVVHAAVSAFTEAGGLSGAAHTMAIGLWIAPPDPAIAGAVGLGTGLGAVIAARSRLFPALADGARALSRPSSFLTSPRAREALLFVWIAAVSAGLSLLFRSAGASPPASPFTLSIGLGATGVALLLAAWAAALRGEPPAGRSPSKAPSGSAFRDAPTLIGATLAGAAHALGVWPGASRVGLAAAALIAIGVRPARALSFAVIATVPFWWARFVSTLPDAGALGRGQILLAALFAFLGALLASASLRVLARRRAVIALPLWMIPLACAIFAYSRAV